MSGARRRAAGVRGASVTRRPLAPRFGARLGAVALAAALALAGCVSIPTGGEVHQGDSDVATPEPVLPILQGPQPDDDARSIVQGFLTASAGGAVTGFGTAREYLAGDAAIEWEPLAKVTVFDSRQVDTAFNEETGTVTLNLPVAATVDESGVMVESASDVRQDVSFTVKQGDDGQYRITSLDDGIIISEANFVRYFRRVALDYATVDLSVVVPDLRWFADNEQIATVAARELVEGPAPYLADAVVTGFPPSSALAVDAVLIVDREASVALAPGSAGTPAERALASEQMTLTLSQLPTVSSVRITIGGVSLATNNSVRLERAPVPPAIAAVIAGQRLGTWNGDEVRVTPADVGRLPTGAGGLALSYDGNTAAFTTPDGLFLTDALSSPDSLELYDADAAPPEKVMTATALLKRANLVAPSFDRHGWLWTTRKAADSSLTVLLPGDAGASVSELAAPWLSGRSVQAISVSRGGARLAVLSRAGGQQVLEVSAIVRDENGVPVALGEPLLVGVTVRPSIDLAWSDEFTLVVLGEQSGDVSAVTVGGRTEDVSVLSGAVHITVRYKDRTLTAVSDEDVLLVRSGNSWAPRASGVSNVTFAG